MGIKQTARRLIAENPGVEAFVASEDGGRSYAFDAGTWFHQADAAAVQRLADAEWGSAMALTPEGFDVSGVTEVLRFFFAGWPGVQSVVDYCSDNKQDCEFRVDAEQASRWLATHPPSVNAGRVAKRIVAGPWSEWLEEISVELGFGGEINDEVMAEAQRRANSEQPSEARTAKRIVAGGMKRWLEEVSVDMGFGGEINDDVTEEGQRRLDSGSLESAEATRTSEPKSREQMLENVPTTRTESLNHGRDGEITLTAAPVKTRGPMQLLPGQGNDGYGKKITLPWTVEYDGQTRRVYCTQFGSAGTWWFMADGKKMIVG